MLGICIRYARGRDEAEDILIEGFVNVFAHLQTFKGESSLETWIKRIMVNAAISNFRKNSKHYKTLSFEEYPDMQVKDNHADIEVSFSRKELLQVIQEMPDYMRVVLNMRAFEAYEYEDIARELNISEITARTRFSRAKKWIEGRMDLKKAKK